MASILLASASERRREIMAGLVSESILIKSRALTSDEINPPSGIKVSRRVEMICSAKAESASEELAISGEKPDSVSYTHLTLPTILLV